MERITKHLIYWAPEYIVGTAIAGINLYNIRLKKQQDGLSQARFAAVSLMKGYIYGSFWPVSVLGIGYHAVIDGRYFKNHFIPLSVYGSKEDNEER